MKGNEAMPWWHSTTIYQVYPRSFQDSDGDGIGDLKGVASRLDYLHDLGVETIWLSPVYPSPQRDFGYDISDFLGIDPTYGTLDDLDRLIDGLHGRGMRLVMDMVLNHTSDAHPWFVESSGSRDNPKADWYIWRDGKGAGGRKPPTNWESLPGGNGWHYHEGRKQWYFSSFLPFQPDLNYHHPPVRAAMMEVLRHWLRKGVDGFRLDIFNAIVKDPSFADNPFSLTWLPSKDGMRANFQRRQHSLNHPGNFALAQEVRAVVDAFPDRFVVGEVFGPHATLRQFLGPKQDGLHLIFLFDMLFLKWRPSFFRKRLEEYERHYPAPLRPTFVVGNHDSKRSIARLGGDLRKAKLLALMQMTTRGVPVIYYGDEIGMLESEIPKAQAQDPLAHKYAWVPAWLRKRLPVALNRDVSRAPMQWTPDRNAGFCPPGKAPWVALAPDHPLRNVLNMQRDSLSLWQCYRSLLHLRRAEPILRHGTLRTVPTPGGTLGYIRSLDGTDYLVALNFTESLRTLPIDRLAQAPLFAINGGAQSSDRRSIILPPLSGGIWPLGAAAP